MKFAGSIETQPRRKRSYRHFALVNCSWIAADEQISWSFIKAGPDGGINGQWDLSGAASPIDSRFTRKVGIISFEPESP